MNSVLIFYTAHKTGYCETALKSVIAPMGINIENIIAAVSVQHFGESINNCLNSCDTLFIVGDISRTDKAGLMPVLSCGLKDAGVSACKINAEENTGYLLQLGNKKLVVLPDVPEQISRLVTVQLADYLKTEK